jgi:hypothetical protein
MSSEFNNICTNFIINDECQFCKLKFDRSDTLGYDIHVGNNCVYEPKLYNDSWHNYININYIHNKTYENVLNYLYNLIIMTGSIPALHLYTNIKSLPVNNNTICYVEYFN